MHCSTSMAEAEAPAAAAPAAATVAAEPDISALDIRVGKIMQCAKHPDAEVRALIASWTFFSSGMPCNCSPQAVGLGRCTSACSRAWADWQD